MAEIDRARDLLAEARRYVRTSVCASKDYVEDALEVMDRARRGHPELGVFVRLESNLGAGLAWMLAAPSVLEGYIDGASWELLALQGRREGIA